MNPPYSGPWKSHVFQLIPATMLPAFNYKTRKEKSIDLLYVYYNARTLFGTSPLKERRGEKMNFDVKRMVLFNYLKLCNIFAQRSML